MVQATKENIYVGATLTLARNDSPDWPIGRKIVISEIRDHSFLYAVGDSMWEYVLYHVGDFDIVVDDKHVTMDNIKVGMILENARNPIFGYLGMKIMVTAVKPQIHSFDFMCMDNGDIHKDISGDGDFIRDLDIVDISGNNTDKDFVIHQLVMRQSKLMGEIMQINNQLIEINRQ